MEDMKTFGEERNETVNRRNVPWWRRRNQPQSPEEKKVKSWRWRKRRLTAWRRVVQHDGAIG